MKKILVNLMKINNYKLVIYKFLDNKLTFQESLSCIQIILLSMLGAILTLAYHPFDIIITVPLSISCLLFLLRYKRSLKIKFFMGVIYGYSYFLSSLYWISYSLFIDIKMFFWLIPFILILIPLFLSLFIGLLVISAEYFNYNKIAYTLAFSALWVIYEKIRSFILLPFPWNLLGYTALFSDSFSQLASIVGVYGMSFIICTIGSCFYTKNYKYIAFILFIIIIIYTFGYIRLKNSNIEYFDTYKLKLIHPNIIDHHMGDYEKQKKDFLKMLELSFDNLQKNTIIIWPEASFPYVLDVKSYYFLNMFKEFTKDDNYIIFGADWLEDASDMKLYNALISIGNNKLEVYKKNILVPFGEYIPLRNYLPKIINKIAYGMSDFKSGNTLKTLKLNDTLPLILPLICYEGIFSHIPSLYKHYDIIINITNDSWFGNSIGPYQHFNMVRMRAIEYNVPLIRVAKYGISGVIDQYGRVITKLKLNKEGVINTKLPKKTLQSSVYLLYYYADIVCMLLLIFILYCLKNTNKHIIFQKIF